MKRLAAILLLVSCFFSCREEEPALLFDIEGLWVENYDEYGYTALREGVPSYMFNNDNSWELYEYNDVSLYHSTTYHYDVQGNVITLIYGDDETDVHQYNIVSLNDTEMEWQRVGTVFSENGLSKDYKHFTRTGTLPENSIYQEDLGRIPRDELDLPVVEGKFDGYVYDYGYCNEPNFWHQFKSFQERVDMFQIPDENLMKLTTEGLSHTCMYYPLRMDVHAMHGIQFVNIVMSEWKYNGLRELALRKHAPEALLKLYENMKLSDPADIGVGLYYDNDIDGVWNMFDRNYLEMLLASAYFTPKMTDGQLDRLGEAIYDTTLEILNRGIHSYLVGFAYPYCVLGRIILVKKERGLIELTNEEVELLTAFMSLDGYPSTQDPEFDERVLRASYRLFNQHFPGKILIDVDRLWNGEYQGEITVGL